MKKYGANLVINVVLLIVSVVFLALLGSTNVLKLVTCAVGVLLLVTSFLFLVQQYMKKNNETEKNGFSLGLIPSAGSLFFGFLMLHSPETYCPLLGKLLGLSLCILGSYLGITVLKTTKKMILPKWFLVVAGAIFVFGFFIVVFNFVSKHDTLVIVMTSLAYLAYNVVSVMLFLCERRYDLAHPAQDVEAQEVDSNLEKLEGKKQETEQG